MPKALEYRTRRKKGDRPQRLKQWARARLDWYVEEPWAVTAFLKREPFEGLRVWDPAAGMGRIADGFAERGRQILSSDIGEHRREGFLRHDFMGEPPPFAFDAICCNPPYHIDTGWVWRALMLNPVRAAFLLRLNFLESNGRNPVLQNTCFRAIYVSSARISMPPGEMIRDGTITVKGGHIAYAWFVWERGYEGEPAVRFLGTKD